MKLHNRQIKAEFWTDAELQFELEGLGRLAYLGFIQIADDSGCLEDDIRAFKLLLFPVDVTVTMEHIEGYRDKLVSMGKLIPYVSQGKKCLFLKNFHKHQALRSPSAPTVPLPSWVKWIPSEESRRSGKYIVELSVKPTELTVQSPYGERTVTEGSSSSGSSSIPSSLVYVKEKPVDTEGNGEQALLLEPEIVETKKADDYSEGYKSFWKIYPCRVEKRRGFECWKDRLEEGHSETAMIDAATNYAAYAKAEPERKLKHPSTFLGPRKPFEEWINEIPAGMIRTSNAQKDDRPSWMRMRDRIGE